MRSLRANDERGPDLWSLVDLPERHHRSYFACLEEWSDEMAEAGDHKATWFDDAQDKGLRVKLALDRNDRPIGMIQYGPIELMPAEGDGLYMILCIWVHGYRQGVGRHQGAGIGTALLLAAEDDARARGASGMAAWGVRMPVWMKSSWFKKHGYRSADQHGARELVWKPFVAAAAPPKWLDPAPPPAGAPDTVNVVAYRTGWCPAANLVYERARKAAIELGTEVTFSTVDTSERDSLVACGRGDEVLLEGRSLQRGAPPSQRTIRRRMARRVRKMRRSAGRGSAG